MNSSPKFLSVQCPSCGTTLKLPPHSAGKKSRCRECNEIFVVPDAHQDPFDYAETLSRLTGDYSAYLKESADPFDDMNTIGAGKQPDALVPPVSAPADSALKVGSLVDERYLITGRLGSGAMGDVYRVVDTVTEVDYAMKVLSRELRNDTKAVKQLHKELAISQQLTHPQLLRMHHFDSTSDHSFIVMEYITGQNLDELRLIKGGILRQDEVKAFLANIAGPLDYLHEQGIVHLDLKPHNLMYVGDDLDNQLKIADFGISRSLKDQISRGSVSFDLQGTLCYMAPEQLKNQVCDRRTDIYALGIILYQLLTGEFPFPLTKPEDIIAWHIGPEAQLDQQGELWDVIRTCLQRDPANRFASCAEALEQLNRVETPEQPETERATQHDSRADDSGEAINEPEGKPEASEKGYSYVSDEEVYSLLDSIGLGSKTPFRTNTLEMTFALIRAGSFRMSSPASGTRHTTLTHDYYLGIHQVTQSQYESIMGTNPSYFPGSDHPVENVSWDDAVEFCRRLSAKDGIEYRLPTEAEWEYACRSGTANGDFGFYGDINAARSSVDEARRFAELLNQYAWTQYNSGGKTHAVGQKLPNEWGLYDMHGNVFEWCQDWWADKYAVDQMKNPKGPATGTKRVVRGGCALTSAGIGCGERTSADVWTRENVLGFRIAFSKDSD